MTSGRKLLSRLGWGVLESGGCSRWHSRFFSFGCGLPPNPVCHPWKHVLGFGFCVRFSEIYLASARWRPSLTITPGHKQAQWDRPLLNEVLSPLEERLQDPYDQARIKASQSSHASDWLHALPISARGLRLDDETVRVAVGLRLGVVTRWSYASLTCAHAGPKFHLEVHMDFLAHRDLDIRPCIAMSMT